MKTKVTVQKITHDELENLFCTAMLGNYRWTVDCGTDECFRDTLEDSIAATLLTGATVFVFDNDADSAVHGNLADRVEKDGRVRYSLSIFDIQSAVERILNGNDSRLKALVHEWTGHKEFLSVEDADELLQYIVFGNIIDK